uniref:Uncharacterized protein n=1 Tax=Arundo donax TaxID=35708 RepID=A0A0A9EWY0_ARUDO
MATGLRSIRNRLTNFLNIASRSSSVAAKPSNSWREALMRGTERQRSRHRRDSTQVCTTWRASRWEMARKRRSSGRALILLSVARARAGTT